MALSKKSMLDIIRSTLLTLPGTREGLCYGMIAFYAGKKLLCNLKEDGETLHLYHHDRDELIAEDPDVFFTTDHYKNYPGVLIRLPVIARQRLKDLLLNAWLLRTNNKHLKSYNKSTYG